MDDSLASPSTPPHADPLPADSPADPAAAFNPAGGQPAHPLHRVFFGADGLRAGWSLLLFFAMLFLLGRVAILIARHVHPTTAQQRAVAERAPMAPDKSILGECIPFAIVALATFVMSRIERRPLRAYGIGITARAGRQFLTGLLWGVALLSLLVLSLWQLHLLVFNGLALSGAADLRFGAEWAIAFLFVGLLEEYTTRGYVQFTVARGIAGAARAATGSRYAPVIGFWIAAAFFSFIFGFGHKNNAGESPIGLVSAGLIGLVFCFSLWRTGSLWWAIGFHAAWDWAQSFVYGVADSGHMVAFHLLNSHPLGTPLLSGGLTGPEGSILILPIVLLTALAVFLTLRRTDWPIPGSNAPSLDRS